MNTNPILSLRLQSVTVVSKHVTNELKLYTKLERLKINPASPLYNVQHDYLRDFTYTTLFNFQQK